MERKEYFKPKIPELLAPAGNMEKLRTAVHYGADAVYCGGRLYSLRALAENFSEAELEQAVQYAHEHSVKLYVAVNILAHNEDFRDLDRYITFLDRTGIDGIIVSDPGILARTRRLAPGLPVHLSTQVTITNSDSARFWQEQGVRRLNLARELSLAEITAIRNAVDTEIEVFVHGALCISYSGRCLLSYYLTGRDANRGACAHPCRYSYTLLEEKRPGQFFPVEEDGRGTYIFNSKDLCLLNRLPQLLAAGVDSLKIEGRMKSVFYVGSVVRVYRAVLDYLAENGIDSELPPVFMAELLRVGTRGYTENFFNGPPGAAYMIHQTPRLEQTTMPTAVIRGIHGDSLLEIEARNTLKPGEQMEYMGRGLETVSFTVEEMTNRDGDLLQQANPKDHLQVKISCSTNGMNRGGLLRRLV